MGDKIINEQTSILPYRDPDTLIAIAKNKHRPIRILCLFSGGNDSTVLADVCRNHYDTLVHIDTGTAVPGVREFVESFAAWLEKPLIIYESGDMFRRMVLGKDVQKPGPGFTPLGFPGPGQHGRAYARLKERQLEAILRDSKHDQPRTARVLALTGIRRAESTRRATRSPITRKGSLVFCNPLIDWSDLAMRAYRRAWKLPESDVAALIHRSGECNCGSYAAPGEREMLASLWPEWFERTIASLEREAEAAGIPSCRWGGPTRHTQGSQSRQVAGPLCTDCQLRLAI